MITNIINERGLKGLRSDYIGLSTDEKPTDCDINSLFFELDTGNFYYYTGSAWAKVGG